MDSKFSWELFDAMPIVGIMRNLPAEQVAQVAQTYHNSGFTCLEITMNSAGAEENIYELAKAYNGKLNIGAGTVCNMSDLEKALKANAQFIVAPIIGCLSSLPNTVPVMCLVLLVLNAASVAIIKVSNINFFIIVYFCR